jgi:hypothetical protein
MTHQHVPSTEAPAAGRGRDYYFVEDLVEQGFPRTRLFAAMRSGALRAKRFGRRNIIRHADFDAFVSALPDRACA